MDCKGLHCPGCGHGGSGAGWPVGAGLVILAVIAAERKPIGHAVSAVLHGLALAGLALAGLAVAAGITLAVVKLRRRALARASARVRAERPGPAVSVPEAAWRAEVIAVNGRALPAPQRPAYSRTERPFRDDSARVPGRRFGREPGSR